MAKLNVRTSLTHNDKTERLQNTNHFLRFENWNITHRALSRDKLSAHKLAFEVWLSILEQHLENFVHVLFQFIQSLTLRMRARETWNITHVKTCFRTLLDD